MNALIYLLSALLFLNCGAVVAQQFEPTDDLPTKKWRISQLNFGSGIERDHFQRMSLTQIMGFAKNTQEIQRDLVLFEEEVSTVTSGVGLYANVGFAPLSSSTGSYSTVSEVQVGVSLHTPREAMVTYKNQDMDTSIVYCNMQREVTLETAYILKGKLGKHVHFYGGLGVNGGLTLDNKMIVIEGRYLEPGEHPSAQSANEMNKHTFGAKQTYYSRLYIPYGIKYGIGPKWQVGLDLRTGIGWQFLPGGITNYIKYTGVFSMGAKYCF